MPDNDWTKNIHYSIDPFPEIAPSLLNSADIVRYAKKGCLIHPFCTKSGLLNPATYTIRLLGTRYWWEPNGSGLRRREQKITVKTPVKIKANSISYLFTEEEFRLPQYIAARFNLHIRYVHKGILLGTGPLVDPGFSGSLLIPLHNLTDNDYKVQGGDNLLWVEFTKLTHHEYWSRPPEKKDDQPTADLVLFNAAKFQIDADKYFAKSGVSAAPGVLSAFKGALEESRSQAEKSKQAAQTAHLEASTAARKMEKWTLGGGFALGIGILTLVFAAWEIWQNSSDMAGRIHDRLDRIEREIGLLPPLGSALPTNEIGTTEDTEQPAAQDTNAD